MEGQNTEMSAIKQIPKDKIIDAATELVRKNGMSALNARTLAKELGCSTRPIYITLEHMPKGCCIIPQGHLLNCVHSSFVSNS